ncbi:MAG: hypothetical protein OES10_14165 [Gammaproteobacteria bacterium]|nr:hypothetical protein [Gammaproteobacteria bacterium]
MYKILIATASLLVPLIASGEVLDKSSSFSAEQDSITGIWTLECESEVSGIDRLETHSVDIYVEVAGGDPAVIFSTRVDILPTERSVTESAEGIYEFEVKKKGSKLVVSFDATWFATTGDEFYCTIGIYKGIYPPPAGNDLYLMRYRYAIISSGTP